MQRKIVIIHGTGGNPEENWFPWLAAQATGAGIDVAVPQFPTPDGQTPAAWLEVLDSVTPIGSHTTLVGHSLGCALMLKALERPGEPAEATIFVSGFVGKLDNPEFDPLNAPFFADPFDWERIQSRSGAIEVVMGDNDPYVPLDKGKDLAALLKTQLTLVPEGGHLNTAAGYDEFPRLWGRLREILKLA